MVKHRRSPRVTRECKLTECSNQFEVTVASDQLFCSQLCARRHNFRNAASKAGLASVKAQATSRRSLNEKFFAQLCKENFSSVKENEAMFNGWDADVILPDLKIAVLWNGKWHYEKITQKHSVEQVQNRDRIKMKEIANTGYTCYVIKDMGKFNESFVRSEFEKFKQSCLQSQ